MSYETLWVLWYSLYDALSVTSVDDNVTSEWWWIGKDLVESGRGLILRYYPRICLKWLRKTTRNLHRDSRSPGPTFEPGTSRMRSRSVNHSATTFGLLWEMRDQIHTSASDVLTASIIRMTHDDDWGTKYLWNVGEHSFIFGMSRVQISTWRPAIRSEVFTWFLSVPPGKCWDSTLN
jgi:hypothetical protein